MKKLVKHLKGYTKQSILGPLFKLFEANLELIVPLIIADIIDNGILASDASRAVKMSLLLVLLGAIGLIFSVTAQYYCAKASVGFATGVRFSLFKKIQTLSYSDIDRIGESTLITRMTSDTQKVQNGLNLTLRLLLRSPFIVFGAMIMAFTVDVRSATIFAITIPVLSVIVFSILLVCLPLYKKVQKGTDAVLEKTRESLEGTRVIRAFRKEADFKENFNKRNTSLCHSQKKVGIISALMNPLTYVVINIAILVLIYTGALQVNSGNLTTGEVLALYNYMSQILIELIKLANLIITVTRALASASRISNIFDITSTENMGNGDSNSTSVYSVQFKNVSLRYDGAGDDSLFGITFSVKRGQTVGIIGGTGSGKSSLINLIPAFYKASEGAVLIDGVNAKDYSPATLREKIGIVPQKAVLFKGTLRDNLKWRKQDATDEEMLDAIEMAQAADFVLDKGGLDAEIEQSGQNLSGGQRQRLTIARALVGSPEILILDDSASALDYATDAKLRQAISNIKDTTVFIVSQRASSVMNADLIIVLNDGEAVGIGKHEELLTSCEVYQEIYNAQFDKSLIKEGSKNG